LIIVSANQFNRFERSRSSQEIVINSLLLVQESKIVRTRDKSVRALNRRQEAFDIFIARKLSQFERLAMKEDDNVSQKIERAVHRANSISDRDRGRERSRERASEMRQKRKRAREIERERERTRKRDADSN
jgi:hypothetical protein